MRNYVLVAAAADGNCLFRSVSLALYGVEDYHVALRASTAVEVLTHRRWYDASVADCVNPLRNVPEIVMPAYIDICRDVTTLGRSCDINVVLALSAVVGLPVSTFWLPLCGSLICGDLRFSWSDLRWFKDYNMLICGDLR